MPAAGLKRSRYCALAPPTAEKLGKASTRLSNCHATQVLGVDKMRLQDSEPGAPGWRSCMDAGWQAGRAGWQAGLAGSRLAGLAGRKEGTLQAPFKHRYPA